MPHSSSECEDDLKKGAWTPQVRASGFRGARRRDAREFPCLDPRSQHSPSKNKTTHLLASNAGPQRQQEDTLLQSLVEAHGPQKWSVVAERIKGRSGKSCRLR
jgi:hypothetical protein